MKNTILTNDPSFTAWGWAVLSDDKIIDTGCIKTEPESKKKRIRVGDDRIRRISEIVDHLLKVINKYGVCHIISELPHGSQNANAAVMMGIVTGVLQTIADIKNFSIEWYSEQDAKKSLLGKKSATKEETIKAVQEIHKELKLTGTKYKDEAVCDAIAIYTVAKKQSPIIKALNNLNK